MKLNKYPIFLLIILLLPFAPLLAQDKEFGLEIQNKKYDQLYLEGIKYQTGIGISSGFTIIHGKSDDGYNWKFNIPDSIDQSIRFYRIKYKPYDFITGKDYYLTFSSTFENKTYSTLEFVYDLRMPVFRLEYEKTDERKPSPGMVGDTVYVNNYTVLEDVCKLNIDITGSEMEPIFKHSDFGVYSTEIEAYNKELKECISIVKQYPYSKYILGCVARIKERYIEKEDLKKVFDNFTEENKQSFLGNKIQEYLSFDPSSFNFANKKLPSWNNTIPEDIITDKSKYTLIVFSASWCVPCHKRIPILKEIHEEKKHELDIVYISIDEEQTINEWIKLMKKEAIPWRSLLLLNDEYSLKGKYMVYSIPYMILVPPSGKAMVVDVWNTESKTALYDKITK